MTMTKSDLKFLMALVFLALGAAIFSAKVAGQEEGWRVLRADYGFKSQRTDVTDLLQDLLSRGGVNGKIAVNNQTMGGDPAVGKDKTLRIFSTNRKNQEREFDYKEGDFIEVRTFNVQNSNWDDRGGNYGTRDREDWNSPQIIRAFYGVQRKTVNVTQLLQSMMRNGALSLQVNNNALGGDPAPGADKVLMVIYRYQGKEQAASVREGNTLTIP